MNLSLKEYVIPSRSGSDIETPAEGLAQDPYRTSISSSPLLSQHFGCSIWLKWESENPTGTHKDRESARIIAACLKQNLAGVGCASTGNFAISLAYHAQKADLPCEIWLPHSRALPSVVSRLQDLGAVLNFVEGDLSKAYDISSRELDRRGFLNANPGQCPEKLKAHATLSKEICHQLPKVTHVICPINNGSLFLGLASGLQERNIKLIGAYTHSSSASSICGFHCAEGQDRITKQAVFRKGRLLEASEQDLFYGTKVLLSLQSNTEVSSASTIGILSKLTLKPSDVICCLVTSNGANKPKEAPKFLDRFQRVNHTITP